MNNSFSMHRINKNRLIVAESRIGTLIGICIFLAFFVFWYFGILGQFNFENVLEKIKKVTENNFMMWGFIIFPLFTLPQIIQGILILLRGEKHEFDGEMKEITKNNKKIADFSEVDAIQIRRIPDSDGPDDFRVSLIMHDGRKTFLKQSSNHENISELVDAIADILSVKIISK